MTPNQFHHLPAEVQLPKGSTIFIQNEGYARIRFTDPVTGTRQFPFLHRLIWESLFGPLPAGWVIHHIDGDIGNNDPRNLQGMPRSHHSRLHRLHPELKSEPCARYHAKYLQKRKKRYREVIGPRRRGEAVSGRTPRQERVGGDET